VESLAEAITLQTGVHIEVGKEIRQRRIVCAWPNSSLRDILDDLCELNGFEWSVSGDGKILISRHHIIPKRIDISGVSEAISQMLPPDWRRFIGTTLASEQVLPSPNEGRKAYAKFEQGAIAHFVAVTEGRKRALVARLAREYPHSKRVDFRALTDQLRRRVVEVMILDTVNRSAPSVLFGRLAPYETNPAGAVIELRGNMLSIGSHWLEGSAKLYSGISAAVRKP
jgi:hypothetical protein